jgi:hypothetical protein
MTTIQATIKGRRLELDVPADWPDGTKVEIYPLEQNANDVDDVMSPEKLRARWRRWIGLNRSR